MGELVTINVGGIKATCYASSVMCCTDGPGGVIFKVELVSDGVVEVETVTEDTYELPEDAVIDGVVI